MKKQFLSILLLISSMQVMDAKKPMLNHEANYVRNETTMHMGNDVPMYEEGGPGGMFREGPTNYYTNIGEPRPTDEPTPTDEPMPTSGDDKVSSRRGIPYRRTISNPIISSIPAKLPTLVNYGDLENHHYKYVFATPQIYIELSNKARFKASSYELTYFTAPKTTSNKTKSLMGMSAPQRMSGRLTTHLMYLDFMPVFKSNGFKDINCRLVVNGDGIKSGYMYTFTVKAPKAPKFHYRGPAQRPVRGHEPVEIPHNEFDGHNTFSQDHSDIAMRQTLTAAELRKLESPDPIKTKNTK